MKDFQGAPVLKDSENRRVIGVYGGSFSPLHWGHVWLPRYVLGQAKLDEVWVLPCYQHAFAKELLPFATRLRWLERAFAGDTRVRVSGIEASLARRMGRAPYTLEVLEALALDRPELDFRLIVGSDIVESGDTQKWHRWDRIEAEFRPVVVPRSGGPWGPLGMGSEEKAQSPLPAISSSEVRELVAAYQKAGAGARSGTSLGSGSGASPSPEQLRRKLESMLPAFVLRELCGDKENNPDPECDFQAEGGSESSLREAGIWILGQGKAGTSMRRYLERRGIASVGLAARADASQWQKQSKGKPPAMVWLATRRDSSEALALKLVDAAGLLPENTIVLQASGADRADALLAKLASRGFSVGTLHPIQSLTGDPEALGHCYFGWEGDAAVERCLFDLGLGPRLVDLRPLNAPQRLQYHLACTLVANYWAGVAHEGQRLWDFARVQDVSGGAALLELMRGALCNLKAGGVPEGVSGPLARGEEGAFERGRKALLPGQEPLHDILAEHLRRALRAADAGSTSTGGSDGITRD